MNAGLILKNNTEEDSILAFVGEETSCHELETNKDIVEQIVEKEPEVVAVNVGTNTGREEFTETEQELKDEGHAFLPNSHSPKLVKRLDALKKHVFKEMAAKQPEFIRFSPMITADELALHGDEALESLGVDASPIKDSEKFDAVLGAVTARFYQQNQYRDLGVIVPESLETEQNT